ncbi:MAG: hypothetical protein ABW157_06035 [Candidatus Thiodiazotropha sp. LLP2]
MNTDALYQTKALAQIQLQNDKYKIAGYLNCIDVGCSPAAPQWCAFFSLSSYSLAPPGSVNESFPLIFSSVGFYFSWAWCGRPHPT